MKKSKNSIVENQPRNFVHKYGSVINTAKVFLDQKKEEKSNPNRKHKNKRFDE